MPEPDNWLDRWLEEIVNISAEKSILELGCGEGRDTQLLCEAGLRVVGLDKSKDAIAVALKKNLDCCFHIDDIRSDFPDVGKSYPVIIASLCLHYFEWEETLGIAMKMHASLEDDGLLFVRVNATDDINYGAIGYPEIESNYYHVNGKTKRFFDMDALDRLFPEEKWNTLLKEEKTIHRYEKPKAVWELVLSNR